MLTCSWLGGPSAGAEAVKRLQLGRWEGAGLSLLSAVSFCLWGFWRLACSPCLLSGLRVTSRGRSQLPWEVLAPASGGPSTWDVSEATACRSVGAGGECPAKRPALRTLSSSPPTWMRTPREQQHKDAV